MRAGKATRYVSASERATILAQGLVRYANWMHSNQKPGNIHHDHWAEWSKVWGTKMTAKVIEVHDQNFTWATHYN